MLLDPTSFFFDLETALWPDAPARILLGVRWTIPRYDEEAGEWIESFVFRLRWSHRIRKTSHLVWRKAAAIVIISTSLSYLTVTSSDFFGVG